MPCDQIIQTKVEFLAKSTDLDLLKKALEAMGFTVTVQDNILYFQRGYRERGQFDKNTGRFECPEYLDANEVKKNYSKEVVNFTAKKNGWQVEWSTNPKTGNLETIVRKRV